MPARTETITTTTVKLCDGYKRGIEVRSKDNRVIALALKWRVDVPEDKIVSAGVVSYYDYSVVYMSEQERAQLILALGGKVA